MGSLGMGSKQVQKSHGGLRENPAYPQDHGECMKGINNPSALWQWDTGWMKDNQAEVVSALTWAIDLININITCVYFPQRTQITPKGNLKNF